MTQVHMNVTPEGCARNETRGQTEKLRTTMLVSITCAAYPRAGSHYGKFTVRFLDQEDIDFFRQMYDVPKTGKLHFAVKLINKGKQLSLEYNEGGYALSHSNEIQVTKLAQMNALTPAKADHFRKIEEITMNRVKNGNAWTISMPVGVVEFADLKNDGTKTRPPSGGNRAGSKNSKEMSRRSSTRRQPEVVAKPAKAPKVPKVAEAPAQMVLPLEVPRPEFNAMPLDDSNAPGCFPASIPKWQDAFGIEVYNHPLLTALAMRLLKWPDFGKYDIVAGKMSKNAEGNVQITIELRDAAKAELKHLVVSEFSALEWEFLLSCFDQIVTAWVVKKQRGEQRDTINRMKHEAILGNILTARYRTRSHRRRGEGGLPPGGDGASPGPQPERRRRDQTLPADQAGVRDPLGR